MTARLLTLAEAARLLGCSHATVKRRVASGELPVFRDGRLVRVRAADLDRYVLARLERGAPARPADPAGAPLRPGAKLWD